MNQRWSTIRALPVSLWPHSLLFPVALSSFQTTSGDDFRDFRKVLHNKVSKKYRRKPQKMSYLDYPVTNDDDRDSREGREETDAAQGGSE